MAITLGKDCTVSFGGNIASARNVTFQVNAKTVEFQEFGMRESTALAIGWDASGSVEFNDASDLGQIVSNLQNGDSFTLSGGAGGWSFQAIPVSILEADSLDGVATFTVEFKLARP